jgi:hypothetical protein
MGLGLPTQQLALELPDKSWPLDSTAHAIRQLVGCRDACRKATLQAQRDSFRVARNPSGTAQLGSPVRLERSLSDLAIYRQLRFLGDNGD